MAMPFGSTSMSPYMMSSLMGGGGRMSPEQSQGPDIVGAYVRGLMVTNEIKNSKVEDQIRNNQLQMQQYEIEQASRKELYDKGMDVLNSKDKTKQADFAKNNPGIWQEVNDDDTVNKAKVESLNAEALKTQLSTLTYDMYKTPEKQARISQILGTDAPKFKNEDGFNAWKMQASGMLDKLTGNLGTLYKLGVIYKETHDPVIKDLLDQNKQHTQMTHAKEVLQLQKLGDSVTKEHRPNFSTNDAFLGISTKIDNDPVLSKLAGDPVDPETGKSTGAGPKSAAKASVSNLARDLYYSHPDIGTEEAEKYALSMYKFNQMKKSNQQGALDMLIKNPDKKHRDAFEQTFGFPSDWVLNGGH